MIQFDSLREKLLGPVQRIVITSHANPDGDAIGSSVGMYCYLKSLGHEVSMIMPTEMPMMLDFMAYFDEVIIFENARKQSAQLIDRADIIFVLDYNSLSRVDDMEPLLRKSGAYKAMIDHHIGPEDICQSILSDTSASSTCQLVYEWIEQMEAADQIGIEALNALYVGILTDTGGFRHATSPRLFRVVAKMLERGVDNNRMSDLVFNAYTTNSFNLLAFCISQRMEILDDCNTGIIALSQQDHQDFQIKRGDLEGVVNFILKIRKIRCAALITERIGIVKLSLRSKGDFSVQKICKEHFNGGGHFNASGGSSRQPFHTVVQRFKELVQTTYKDELTQ